MTDVSQDGHELHRLALRASNTNASMRPDGTHHHVHYHAAHHHHAQPVGDAQCPCVVADGIWLIRGARCNAWDDGIDSACNTAVDDIEGKPEWCSKQWCYVDPCNCQSPMQSTTVGTSFQGQPAFWSYVTCGGGPDDHQAGVDAASACLVHTKTRHKDFSREVVPALVNRLPLILSAIVVLVAVLAVTMQMKNGQIFESCARSSSAESPTVRRSISEASTGRRSERSSSQRFVGPSETA